MASFPIMCRDWQHAPRKCEHETFTSVDGGIRCKGCHLYPDQCNCGGGFLRLLKMLGLTAEN